MGSVGGLDSESFGTGGQTWKWVPAVVLACRLRSALGGGGGCGGGFVAWERYVSSRGDLGQAFLDAPTHERSKL